MVCCGYNIGGDFPVPLASLFGVLALIVLAAVLVLSVVWNALRYRWLHALSCGWIVAAYVALAPLPLTLEYFVRQVRLGNWVRFLVTEAWIARPRHRVQIALFGQVGASRGWLALVTTPTLCSTRLAGLRSRRPIRTETSAWPARS